MIRPHTNEELEQHQARLAESLSVEAGAVRRTAAVVNGDAVRALTLPSVLAYRGRLYDVPPVPFLAGVRLVELRDQLSQAETPADEVRALREIVTVMKRLIRPRGKVRRATWWLRRNPFRHASEQEIGELLGFFSAHRTQSRVRFHSSASAMFGRPT